MKSARLVKITSRRFSCACSSSSSSSNNLYAFSEESLKQKLSQLGIPSFRATQVLNWVYDNGVTDFSEMSTLPLSVRDIMRTQFSFGSSVVLHEQISKDGTRKRAHQLHDGQLIEAVLMPYNDGRRTACISSQAGCAMGCTFCATGQMGFSRQLTSAEIFEQAAMIACELKRQDQRLSNVVFMGMGEPLNNYDNVMTAIEQMHSLLGIGARHITVSTVGIAPKIRRMADDKLQVGLAVSLHQANDENRSRLMPINCRFPIAELMDSCRYYIGKTNRRISFEWALIEGQTDSPETAHELGRLIKGMLCHVNLIPLNPTDNFSGKPTSKASVDTFVTILKSYSITATPRVRRGIDIDAGCGQLTAAVMKKKRD